LTHDPDYQELLNIMRINPFKLIDNQNKKWDSLSYLICFGLSGHGMIHLLHPTLSGYLQRRFQYFCWCNQLSSFPSCQEPHLQGNITTLITSWTLSILSC
jgi:hypothetical protein